jgi:dolichol-phosphate mannosyltransferase
MRLSVVVPCYNETANIDELRAQLDAVMSKIAAEESLGLDRFEFVMVDDGSRDATLDALKAWADEDPRVFVIGLSRNFGHQAALSAGIDHATGDAVVVMDADLQHPPELIVEFCRQWRAGHDLIYAYRKGVKPRMGYRFINTLMKIQVPVESADFRLMDRRVVDAFRKMPEHARFIRGMISWLGFRQIGVGYEEHERFAGERGYTIRQTARMALDAVLAFSNIPLRVASALGSLTLLAGLAYALYILIVVLTGNGDEIEGGWTSLIMTVLILGGVQLMCLGIIAEYIGRIFDEVKCRPLYVVREAIAPRQDAHE